MSTNAKPRNKKRDTKRRAVTGTDHWQVSEDGRIYYNRRERTPQGSTIDLGRYSGEVRPAYGDGSRDRFIDEIFAWEFHGPPPVPWEFVTVQHLDGDMQNNAPDNVRWMPDAEWQEANDLRLIQELMRSAIPAAGERTPGVPRGVGMFPFAPFHGEKMPRINDCPEWADVVPTWVRPPEHKLEPGLWRGPLHRAS